MPQYKTCPNCKGSGSEIRQTSYSTTTTICHQCFGKGELDWIENITGSSRGSDEWHFVECSIDLSKAEEKMFKIPLPGGTYIGINFEDKDDNMSILDGNGNRIITATKMYASQKIAFGCHIKVSGNDETFISGATLCRDNG
ncbi:hypothetical protein KAR91_74000 [Candidatus Pacearchaeota archaeon]|nr:hypothetical protein [Candidatus Pacearchaeota archaeon]